MLAEHQLAAGKKRKERRKEIETKIEGEIGVVVGVWMLITCNFSHQRMNE